MKLCWEFNERNVYKWSLWIRGISNFELRITDLSKCISQIGVSIRRVWIKETDSVYVE